MHSFIKIFVVLFEICVPSAQTTIIVIFIVVTFFSLFIFLLLFGVYSHNLIQPRCFLFPQLFLVVVLLVILSNCVVPQQTLHSFAIAFDSFYIFVPLDWSENSGTKFCLRNLGYYYYYAFRQFFGLALVFILSSLFQYFALSMHLI